MTQHNPPAGDVMTPIPVEIHGMTAGVAASLGQQPQRPHKALRTDFGTETVDDTNKSRPLLPAAPERRCAYIQATGGDVILCKDESSAQQLQGSLLPKTNTAPWPFPGQGAVWIAQAQAGDTCKVSFTADYET
jgi:hypothetical protein